MKTTFLTLVLLVFGFSSFAFMPSFPAENTSESEKNITSEKPKTESENKSESEAKAETKTVTAKELKEKMEANYEANKKDMSFKERIANKLLIKKLKKAEKKQIKDSKETKIDSGFATLLKIIGIIFIVVGVIGIVASLGGSFGYGLGLILVGLLFYLLPSLL
ncbi:hypothetical protein ACE193_07435 [Bernardetia sp. OM2101]|uniref:hypothetical protein n=1 Tax=Bernardetia sp. OM2101 TaxID=3344876 RepID=UPI0035CE9163